MILITGANGFLGNALCSYLSKYYSIRGLVRTDSLTRVEGVQYFTIHDLSKYSDLSAALDSVKIVVHCAGRAHFTNEFTMDTVEIYRKHNVNSISNLAIQAALSGVKRFIFISTIKVNGECTEDGKPFKPEDKPCPKSAYALSKYEAEEELRRICLQTKMEYIIIRPPLIYGRGVKGNLKKLIKIMNLKIPIPFGLANKNKRSFIGIDNLQSFVKACISCKKAVNEIFLVSDGEDISTLKLIKIMSTSGNKNTIIFPFPVVLLKLILKILNKSNLAEQLFNNLQIDITKCQTIVGWSPPFQTKKLMNRMMEYE